MPSTYTNLGFEKQATGENANSWGTITNTNFGIIDEALSEINTISSSSTSQTITAPSDGTENQASRYATYRYTGSPSGAVTVTLPNNVKKIINVINEYSQNITFQVGSGSATATVYGNSSGIIHTDGSNSVYSLSEGSANQLRYNGITKAEAVTGGVNVTGDLSTTGNLTVSGTLNATLSASGEISAGANNITTTATLNAGTVSLGTNGWTVTQTGTNLLFAYNGTNRMKLENNGNLTVTGNVTAYGSI